MGFIDWLKFEIVMLATTATKNGSLHYSKA